MEGGGRQRERGERENKNFTIFTLSLERYHPLKENRLSGSQEALGRAKTGFGWPNKCVQKGPSLDLVRAGLLICRVFVIGQVFENPVCRYPLSVCPLTLCSPGCYTALGSQLSPTLQQTRSEQPPCLPSARRGAADTTKKMTSLSKEELQASPFARSVVSLTNKVK